MTSWLHEQRLQAVLGAIRSSGARTVLDLGCGDGDLLLRLLRERQIERIVGVDISQDALARLRARLHSMPRPQRDRVQLVRGCLTEAAMRLAHFDAAILLEAIEHIEPDRLGVVERTVFRDLQPASVVITTPNADFNPLLAVPGHRFRHRDHRFEWGRARFLSWAEGVAHRNGYSVTCTDLAGAHPAYGGASQMARFERICGHL